MTVHLCHQGRQLGAFSKEQVEAMLKAGVITDGTLAWTPGFSVWKTLREVIGPATPPPVPPPQTVATTTFGLTPGCPSPTDDTPKGGLFSPPSAPPTIAAPVFEARLSEPVRQEILKLAKVPFGQMIAWTLFIIGINTAARHGAEPNPFISLLVIVFGIFVFRSWCKRRSMRVILNRGVLRRIYWPAVWSFGWRSICTGMGVALVLGLGTDSPQEQLNISVSVFGLWMCLSFFAIDVPYWCRRRVEGSICFNCGVAALGHAPPPPKSKTMAVLLAVLLGFGTWCYTYERDAWKFWVNLSLTGVTMGLYGVVAWIWAIIDVSMKSQDYYRKFPYSSLSTKNKVPNNQGPPVTVAPSGHSSLRPIVSGIIAVIFVVAGAGGVWLWLAQKPADVVSRKGEIATEQQRYNQAADQNNVVAQYNLGVRYASGKGVTQDYAEAVKWYRKAAEQNYAPAQLKLGLCYATGQGVAVDTAGAVKWYRKAAEGGNNPAQYMLARCYIDGVGVEQDLDKGVKLLHESAKSGNHLAQYDLGCLCQSGHGVKQDRSEAVEWYRKAAEQNDVDAQRELGKCYMAGKGVERDLGEGIKWLRKAAEQGDAFSEYAMAECYDDGTGVSKDHGEAVKWYRKAAEQDYADAQCDLGVSYIIGEGVVKDVATGIEWIRKAAEQGNSRAQCKLGALFLTGTGTPTDYVDAYKWLNIGTVQDDDPVFKTALSELASQMTPDQIAEAQRLSEQFKPREASKSKESAFGRDISEPTLNATGTGFFITDDGYLISNYHVVKDATKVRLVTSAGLIDAKVVQVDTANDLALLKADGRFASLPIASSRTVNLGGTVATVGFPDIGLQGFAPKLAKGEIASLSGAADDPRYFQISVPVQPGNSGGALVNERGNVIGIVSAKLDASAALAASGQLPENVNYAVKSSLLLSFLESVPGVDAKLKSPNMKDEKFEDVVKSAQDAAVLVLVY